MQCCGQGDSAPNSHDSAAPAPPSSFDSVDPRNRSAVRRFSRIAEWVLPIATLAIVPKCPMCVAAYVVLFTGVGLSIPAANAVRWALIVLSVAALTWLVIRAVRRGIGSSSLQTQHEKAV